jgi:hypothetical protein
VFKLDVFSACRPARVSEKLNEEEKDCAGLLASEFAAKDEDADAEDEALES